VRIRSLAAVTVLAVTGGAPALTTHPASAALSVLIVDSGPTCKDAPNSGTTAQPFCTIQAAADIVQPGQTVDIYSGAGYQGPVKVTQSGTPQAPITLTSHILSGLQGGTGPALDFENVHDVTFSGAKLSATGTTPVVEVHKSSDITVAQEQITDSNRQNTAPLIEVTGNSANVTLTRDNRLFGRFRGWVHAA
jgi:hypothetical protein